MRAVIRDPKTRGHTGAKRTRLPVGCYRSERIPQKWVRILRKIPGYDAIATAEECYFDEVAAQTALDFWPECLHHVKGDLAGKAFALELWEQAMVANLFGWKRLDGTRRYRKVWLYVPKKNGKTTFCAGLILQVMGCDGELGAEIYSAAASRDQASLVFDHAAGMVALEPELKKRFEVYGDSGGGQHKSIVYPLARSSYGPLAADVHTADGVNPHLVIIDEVHCFKKRDLADRLVKSTAARSQPIVIYATTADYARESLCNELLDYARKVRDGKVKDLAFLPVIYEASAEDDWTDPKVWRRVNPNIDVTKSEEFLAAEFREARERPTLENSFKRFHLNMVTEQVTRWIPMEKWAACAGTDGEDPVEWRARMLEALEHKACYGGLDLGSTSDLTGILLLFEHPTDTNKFVEIPWFWMPQDGLERKDPQHAELYWTWIRQGFITATQGDVADYDRIRTDISGRCGQGEEADRQGLADLFGIREIAVDRLFQGAQLCSQLGKDGLEIIAFAQSFMNMAAPTKTLEEMVAAGRIIHGNNPVLNWMASNVTVKQDENGNMKPMKPERNSPLKIDGIVCLLMALARAIGQQGGGSVYEDEHESLFL